MATCITIFSTQSAYNTYINGNNVLLPNVSICEDNDETYYKPYYDYSQDYLTFIAKENTTFALSRNAVSYSLDDGETWTSLAANTASPTVTTGNKIMWKGTIKPAYSYGIGTFSSTGNFDVQGNTMSLLYGDNFKNQTDLTGKNYAFYKLFYQNTKVINIENLSLPATTLASDCYNSMFYSCTSLTVAPSILPASTLALSCYGSMFQNCTSLTTTPELPATTLAIYCYEYMFSGCTSLETAPELPATTLVQGCYSSMFNGCASLTTAPELPATTLASDCYNSMFYSCTSLTTTPDLSATTLVSNCYNSMFLGCTSLTTSPELPATILATCCYQAMFYGCTSLTEASIVPNSVKPVSSDYCLQMYLDTNVPVSNDYSEAAWMQPTGGGSN